MNEAVRVELMNPVNSVLGKLDDTFTTGDGTFLQHRVEFFAWTAPRRRLDRGDFFFMSGFLPDRETVEEREAESVKRFAQAANFEFIPDPMGVFDADQQTKGRIEVPVKSGDRAEGCVRRD